MDVYEAIVGRRTIRQFDPKPIPRGILEKIANAARLAPSVAAGAFVNRGQIEKHPVGARRFGS